ncbi:Protein phosphatase 1H [Lamellibrachia satsuma]|nr:Protein phosphatase 1H [Lamellibrachia satsuma]
MRRLRRRLTIAIGQKTTSVPCAVKLVLPEKFPYNRPWFLGLDPDHSVVSGDHNTRLIISARDSDNLPCRAGYAEVINAGKTTLNEDQAHACDLHVGRSGQRTCHKPRGHHREDISDISDTYVFVSDGDKNDTSRVHYCHRSDDKNLFSIDETDLSLTCQCKVHTENRSVEFGPFLRHSQSDSCLSGVDGINTRRSDQETRHSRLGRDIQHHVLQGHDSEKDLNEKERWLMTYFAIFDGHAGTGAALVAVNLLHHIIKKNLSDVREELTRRENMSGKPQQTPSGLREPAVSLPSPYRDRSASIDVDNLVIGALETAFKEMDAVIGRERTTYQIRGGCTALVAVVFIGKLYVANAGDSRAIIIHKDKVIPMSEDFTPLHERGRLQTLAYLKPELLHNEFCHFEFPKRVTQTDVGRSMLYRDAFMTGWSMKTITEDDTKFPLIYGEGKRARLMATIGVTRGVKVYDLTAETHGPNDVLVLGTDGLWDVMTNEHVQETVQQNLELLDDSDKLRYTSAAFELVLAARGIQEGGSWLLRDGSQASNDDITAFVIPLRSCVQRLSPAPRNDHRVSADNS